MLIPVQSPLVESKAGEPKGLACNTIKNTINTDMKRQMTLRKKLAALSIALLLLTLLAIPAIDGPWISRIKANRYYYYMKERYEVSSLSSRKVELPDGSSYYMYFESANDSIVTYYRPWMITIVWTSDGRIFERVEAFNYRRSRIIGDPVLFERIWNTNCIECPGEDLRAESAECSDKGLYIFRNAKTIDEISKGLLMDGFKVSALD